MREAGRQGQVRVVGFDEDALTLRGVADGTIHSTVVQQPYEFGYQSMKGLVRVLGGDRGWIPGSKQMIVDTKVIDKTNVGEFQSYMRQLLRGG
ncbi:substrate-binding domain-containing protein [Dankookia sp. P2]|uniref:substrate-binding domain-containing protein n=1 Tax=Dankookia sp. P2 TaxID=3423955 RepID=UPI003D667835